MVFLSFEFILDQKHSETAHLC